MRKFFNHLASCFWMSFAFSIILYAPGVEVYFNNAEQFNIGPLLLLSAFVLLALATAIVVAALLGLIHARVADGAQAVGLACCANALLQYNLWAEFFVDYGSGSIFTWDFMLLTIVLVFLLVLPFILAWRFRRFLAKHATRIAIVIILTQIVVVTNSAIHYKAPNYDFKEYAFSEDGKFSFGKKENVIIMVVDCMGEGIFKEVLEKYPELNESLADFTCFDRMISPLPWTMYAVPAMMTGVDFPRKAYGVPSEDDHAAYLTKVCSSESSLFMALKSKGFRTEGYPFLLPTISYSPEVLDNSVPQFMTCRKESVVKILEVLWKKQCPFFLFSLLPSNDALPFLTFDDRGKSGFRSVYDQIFYRRLDKECCVGKENAVFKYLHLQGAHETIVIDDNLERARRGTLKYRQLRGSLRNFELLVSKLKSLGIYDNATILLVGDHTEVYGIYNIAFIKRKDERHDSLVFNSIPCQISDIAGTVLKEYGIVTGLPSLFDRQPLIGDGSVRPEQSRYADFTPLKLSEILPVGTYNFTSCRMGCEKDSLVFENFIDERRIEVGTEVSLFLSRLDYSGVWMSTLNYSQRFPCLRASIASLPDGDYDISLYYYKKDENDVLHKSLADSMPHIRIHHGSAEALAPGN